MAIVTIIVEDYEQDGQPRAKVTCDSLPDWPDFEYQCSPAQLIGLVVLEDLDLLSAMVKATHAELPEVLNED